MDLRLGALELTRSSEMRGIGRISYDIFPTVEPGWKGMRRELQPCIPRPGRCVGPLWYQPGIAQGAPHARGRRFKSYTAHHHNARSAREVRRAFHVPAAPFRSVVGPLCGAGAVCAAPYGITRGRSRATPGLAKRLVIRSCGLRVIAVRGSACTPRQLAQQLAWLSARREKEAPNL